MDEKPHEREAERDYCMTCHEHWPCEGYLRSVFQSHRHERG